ncbi:MAG TPA: branched-chain amino acid ABC transporter permease [Candidatus Paceibacterota bacterium]|nr:branched-chain amino acid ABC transporter permease [Candidatus Paceibacterota bacterium]
MKYLSSATDAVGDRWRGLPKATQRLLTVIFIAGIAVLPMVQIPLLNTPQTDFPSLLFDKIGLYVLMGIGLNVVVGKAGLLDLGYVAFFAIGGYTMAQIGTLLHWSFWLILPLGVVIAMSAGAILGLPTLRLRGDYLAIVTLGFGEIIRITAVNVDWLGANRGVPNIPWPAAIGPLNFEDILNPKPFYWVLLALIILVIWLLKRIDRSRVGRAWEAIREDEDAAELMGVQTLKFKLWAFSIGAGIGGMGGVLFASKVGFISPDNFPLTLSVMFLAIVVLGGSGNIPGVILGALAISYIPERLRGFSEYRVLLFGAALVIMMNLRPQGLLPRRVRGKVG